MSDRPGGEPRVHVKICGVTSPEDARRSVEAGASAIGVNLVPTSPRCVDLATARVIAEAIGRDALVVAVVRDLSVADMRAVLAATGCGCLQLHGDEPPELLDPLLPHAYKAIPVAAAEDVARADLYGGEYVLLDSTAEGRSGGTGCAFDWSLAAALSMRRRVVLAGGLRPENVAEAVRIVRPHTVDVASGVESPGHPRKKDMARVCAFIREALR